ncbi:ectonucleotide pyrophosphatase/phosphodiesterase [Luteimonas sp. 50]|uniref:Ectonucleotide pyrophosphatase/phosphodiesterase n=1 Tax=Cognatiluteimonas sedimenti TaxID=2927791 RepID=A0ABT0A2V8_9GAMM|nr:ectonucleotide pyrophosphatase/phosphodiesterase [Lysobacter sedimenti]MCJ0825278.1 ectonucleotide pyrophosphatase/phosphodiesterase [Lysobacter sedimenti]
MHPSLRFLSWLLAALLCSCQSLPPPTAAVHPVLLVSIDGLRADAVGSGAMPTLDGIAAAGVHADWMNPSYPSLTFPNHYTLVTGLRPDHHGIVNNTMRDAVLGRFSLKDRAAVEDPGWWGGEPAWVTLQKHGGRAATMFWPGSEAPIGGMHPRDWRRFDATTTPAERVDTVLEWLERPLPQRPRLLTLYFDQVDHEGHAYGPGSPQAREAMSRVDAALARLLAGLEARGLRDQVDLLLVSDHGMATMPPGQRDYLDDYLRAGGLGIDAIDVVSRGTSVGIAPRAGTETAVEQALVGRHPHAQCWRKRDVPARWHYGTHPRVPPVVCQADVGWDLTARASHQRNTTGGAHGFAPEAPDMRAVFIADGPGFADGVGMRAFDNVDVYPLLMRLLGIPAQPNDGNPHTFDAVLEDRP